MAEPAPPAEPTRARLRADARRSRRHQAARFGYAPLTWFLDPGFLAVLIHRLAHAAQRRGRHRLARLLAQAGSLLTGADIQPQAEIGAGLLIPSPFGTNISGRIGPGLTLGPIAGIGGSLRDHDVGAGIGLPVVGRDVTVNWFVGVQGSILVGDGAAFGPGSGVVAHVGAGDRHALKRRPLLGDRPAPPPPHAEPCPACGHAAWPRTRAAILADADRVRDEAAAYGGARMSRASALLMNGVLALAVHRLAHRQHCLGRRRAARLLTGLNRLLHKVWIAPESCLGDGVLMPHLAGVALACRAGPGLTVYANAVGLGAGGDGADRLPRLGEDVMIAGHAAVIGPVAIGDGARLGPKAQVMEDMPPGSLAIDPLGWAGTGWDPPAAGTRAAAGPVLSRDHPWRETWHRMAQDRARRPRGLGLLPAACTVLHRLSHACHETGWRRPARWLWWLDVMLTGADIAPESRIGGGLLVPHPAGIAFRGCAGADLTLGPLAGVGAALEADDRPPPLGACPVLGDRVEFAAHSGAFGAIAIGDDVLLQPGCVAEADYGSGLTLLPRRLRIRSKAFRDRARPGG